MEWRPYNSPGQEKALQEEPRKLDGDDDLEDIDFTTSKESSTTTSFQMKRSLDQGKLMDGMKHCSTMIGLLKSSDLTPKKYYELYMYVSEHMQYLENFLLSNKHVLDQSIELYEAVQEDTNLLSRMYLMITVGAVYIKMGRCSVGAMLVDMVEMCKGVQTPLRGLFLRHYLLQVMKDKIPDVGQDSYQEDDIRDSIDFILRNFSYMSQLWIRMQNQTFGRRKERVEKERLDLRILVGANLVRLSQLEGLQMQKYAEDVLPRILEQIINSKDRIAQEYLIDCVIQVFPEEFHLNTLDLLLSAFLQFQDTVNFQEVTMKLVTRLIAFMERQPDSVPSDLNFFDKIASHIQELIETRYSLRLQDGIGLYNSLVTCAIKLYPHDKEQINQAYQLCYTYIKSRNSQSLRDALAIRSIVELITFTISTYGNVEKVLDIDFILDIVKLLDYPIRKKVAITMLLSLIYKSQDTISNTAHLNTLFSYLSPILEEQSDGLLESEESRNESFDEEQNLVAKLLHFISNADTDTFYEMLVCTRDQLEKGGPLRRVVTLPALFFRSLYLTSLIREREDMGEKVVHSPRKGLQICMSIIQLLLDEHPELCHKLILQAALLADRCQYEAISNEFMVQACLLYEERITESHQQYSCVSNMIGTLLQVEHYEYELYDALITKMSLYANRLLRKNEQCRAVYMCSHLFWITRQSNPEFRNGKRVLECLKKSLRIADACVDSATQVQLFIEVLNEYLYYFEGENEWVTANYISVLLSLISSKAGIIEITSTETESTMDYYRNTQAYISLRQQNAHSSKKYMEIGSISPVNTESSNKSDS